jgi:hypothetical protein
MKYVAAVLFAVALAVSPNEASSQSLCMESVRTYTDSMRAESKRSYIRKLHLRRFATKIDEIVLKSCTDPHLPPPPPPPPDSTPGVVEVGFDYETTVSWPNEKVGSLPNANGSLLCAKVKVNGKMFLGDRAIVARFVSQDSLSFSPATATTWAVVQRECSRVFPLDPVLTWESWPVVWSSAKVLVADIPVSVPVAAGKVP